MSKTDMSGKDAGDVLWLVGASSGIGRSLAEQLADRGWRVAASARRKDDLDELVDSVGQHRLRAYPLDVTDPATVATALSQIESEMGPVAVAIFNAGDYLPMPLAEFDAALFRRLIEVNYMGAVHCLEALLPRLRARGAGQVLLNASASGYRGLPMAAPYSASKAALINMAEALQPELRKVGVHMRVINPGFVATRLTKKNRFGMPFLMTAEQAAKRICAGLDRQSFEIAFPRRLVWPLKLLRCLPYRAYFALVARITRA